MAARLQECLALPSTAHDIKAALEKIPEFSHWDLFTLTQQRVSNLSQRQQWMGHIISPEHFDRSFSSGILQESTTKVMCHDTDTSSLKTGHAHPVSSEIIKTAPLHHRGPPQAPRTVGRTSEVISPMSHRTDISQTQVSLGNRICWLIWGKERRRESITNLWTSFLERWRNYSRAILCQHSSRNFKSNRKLQRNYLDVIVLILKKLNYAEDTMPLHRQWPHCSYMMSSHTI